MNIYDAIELPSFVRQLPDDQIAHVVIPSTDGKLSLENKREALHQLRSDFVSRGLHLSKHGWGWFKGNETFPACMILWGTPA